MSQMEEQETQMEEQEGLQAKLFAKLERELVDGRFQRLKRRLTGKHGLPAGDLGPVIDAGVLFPLLIREDKIRLGDYKLLKEALKDIGEKNLTKEIELYEERIRRIGSIEKPVESEAISRKCVHDDGCNVNQEISKDKSMERMDTGPSTSRDPSIEYKIGSSSDGKSGLMIIFNMFTVQRRGSEKDSERLKNIFEGEFNFEVRVYENEPKADVLREMATIRKEIEDKNYSQLFYVMMSHGDKNGIWTCRPPGDNFEKCEDEQITIGEILTNFTAEKSRKLSGLPKVFLIQACRGHDFQDNLSIDGAGPHEKMIEVDVPLSNMHTPKDADILVAYSQTEDYVSFRDEDGSWFIQDLCGVFEQKYRQHHVLDMMTMVNKKLATRLVDKERVKKMTKGKIAKDSGQISCQVSTFRNNLYLG